MHYPGRRYPDLRIIVLLFSVIEEDTSRIINILMITMRSKDRVQLYFHLIIPNRYLKHILTLQRRIPSGAEPAVLSEQGAGTSSGLMFPPHCRVNMRRTAEGRERAWRP